jgi:hypothetical protein
MQYYNTSELLEFCDIAEVYYESECCKLMIEAGADFEIQSNECSNFEWMLMNESAVSSCNHLTAFDILI